MTKERKRLIKKFDDLWGLRIKERAKWRCERCKTHYPDGGRGYQAAHIISRGASPRRVRWDLRNGVALCTGCHFRWAHPNPKDFEIWIREKIGDKTYEALEKKQNETGKIDYDEILKGLESA